MSDTDRKNFQDFIKNLNSAVKDLKYGINKEIGKIQKGTPQLIGWALEAFGAAAGA